MRQCDQMCLCVCLYVHVPAHTHTIQTVCVLFTMLSGRLWSHDHQAAPTAAMNHCIIELPLDRRGERGGGRREIKREGGRDGDGGSSGVVGQGNMETRWRKVQVAKG